MHLYDPHAPVLPIEHPGHRPNRQASRPWTVDWHQTDAQYLYQSNLQRLALDWYYRDHTVTYTWNSMGYRAPEFLEVDWAQSWVIMGGSDVVGTGVAYEHTLGENLSLILDAPVINLGVSGGTVNIMQYNTALMIEQGLRPKGVIILVPPLERITHWGPQMTNNLTSQDADNAGLETWQRHLAKTWMMQAPHAELQGHLNLRGLRAEWLAQGVACRTFTAVEQANPGFEFGPRLPPQQDMARDVEVTASGWHGHPGRNTLRTWARFIAEQIAQPYL